MQDALKGITILEVGVMTPGKYCGFLLTGWGAKSIRIERAAAPDGISEEDLLLNRGKQSIILNLRDEGEKQTFLDLARDADVLIESYRPGVTDRLGIAYGDIQAINPGIIYCSLSGFGQDGPDASRPAYDLLFQAETGMLQALFGNSGAVVPPQAFLSDAVSGLMAAFAVSAALQARGHSGRGRQIDLSMQESLFSLLSVSHGTIRDGVAISAARSAIWSRRPVYNVYRAGDGRDIAITAVSEQSSRALFRYLGNEALWQQGLLAGDDGQAALDFLQERFTQNAAQFWVDELSQLGVEIALVKSAAEALDDPQLQARNMSLETQDQYGQTLRQIGFPATAAGSPNLDPAPVPGEKPPTIKRTDT
jgi:crotonobetainyl-CoA:carnitine CoA-transferase CaiB-like acyl-CoA transferase